MATAEKEVVQFVPLVSRLDAGFWHELSRRKLEKYHLSEAAQYISGYYTNSRLHTRKSQIFCSAFLSSSCVICVRLPLRFRTWSTCKFPAGVQCVSTVCVNDSQANFDVFPNEYLQQLKPDLVPCL